MKTFTQNADNFISKNKLRNSNINASAHLAEKLGYTSQQLARIKLFADWQYSNDIAMNDPSEGVALYFDDININSPWMEETGRWELTDVGALNCYGEEFLREWCGKANDALKDDELVMKLKEWSQTTDYIENFPFCTPAEYYGVEW